MNLETSRAGFFYDQSVDTDETGKNRTKEQDHAAERLAIWREMLADMEQKGEQVKDGQIGPWLNFEFTDHDGNVVHATEQLSLTSFGQVFELSIFVEGEKIAKIRYQSGEGKFNMKKTEVDERFRRLGLNTRLFKHMTELQPENNLVYTSLDDTNFDVYLENLQDGLSPVEAAYHTPAGRIRENAGWVLDPDLSYLPAWTEGIGLHSPGDPYAGLQGSISPVYKRADSTEAHK